LIFRKQYSDQYYLVSGGDECFYFNRIIPLAPKLRDELKKKEKNGKLFGFEPNIRRLWMVIDNTLYLWRYMQSSVCNDGNDFVEFSEIPDTIQNIAFAKSNKCVSENTGVCIIATSSFIYIVLVSIDDDDRVTFYNSGMKAPIDSKVTKIE